MINHGRTLLLNRPGDARPDSTYFLEEYVPPDFEPVELSDSLYRVYQAIIGTDSDDAYANYCVWSLLRAIHATPYVSALTDLDPRITYMHKSGSPEFGFKVLDTNDINIAVYPNQAFISGPLRRKMYFRWLLLMGAASQMTITSMTGDGIHQQTVSGGEGLTDPVVLSGQDNLSVSFGAYPIEPGSAWELQGLLRPADSPLSKMVTELERLDGAVEQDILGSTAAPYPTFRKLWKEHAWLHYRLAGFILGYIYKVEELRVNG